MDWRLNRLETNFKLECFVVYLYKKKPTCVNQLPVS